MHTLAQIHIAFTPSSQVKDTRDNHCNLSVVHVYTPIVGISGIWYVVKPKGAFPPGRSATLFPKDPLKAKAPPPVPQDPPRCRSMARWRRGLLLKVMGCGLHRRWREGGRVDGDRGRWTCKCTCTIKDISELQQVQS